MAGGAAMLSCFPAKTTGLSPRPRYPSMPKYPYTAEARDVEAGRPEKQTVLFSVVGMTCSACAGSIEKAIKRLPGIHDAAVDVLNNRARVIFYPEFVSDNLIRETIEDVGFEAAVIEDDAKERSILTCRLLIKGMTCTSCSGTIESNLQGIHGVQKAIVALATEEAEVRYDPQLVSTNQLMETIEDTGFEATLITAGEDRNIVYLKMQTTVACDLHDLLTSFEDE